MIRARTSIADAAAAAIGLAGEDEFTVQDGAVKCQPGEAGVLTGLAWRTQKCNQLHKSASPDALKRAGIDRHVLLARDEDVETPVRSIAPVSLPTKRTLSQDLTKHRFWQRIEPPLPEMFQLVACLFCRGPVGRCYFARLLLGSLEFRARVCPHGLDIRYCSRCADDENCGDQVSTIGEFRDSIQSVSPVVT